MSRQPDPAETLFFEALELAAEDRARFVAEQCGSNAVLRREVESLLAAHVGAGEFLKPLATTRLDPQASGNLQSFPTLPGFRLERELGQGSLGVVYAAYDEKLQRRVAIKVLRRGTGDKVRARVLEEARRAAKLADPAVVTVFSVLDDTDPPAIVMELVEGFALDEFARELTFDQKARLLREVARGLAAAHRNRLIHRDLKPENIVVGPDMRPRILDFGLSLSVMESGAGEGRFEGTPLYASPEQARGQLLSPASDIFSFGSVMFKVLTGRAPFQGETIPALLRAIAETRPPFLREVALGVPEDLQAVCLACLAWEPADRPTAQELVVELGRFLMGEPVRLRPKLYDDVLRQDISRHAERARTWVSQSIISREEHDALEVVHRRLLAEPDDWIIDARRITLLQTVLSAATWLTVVATLLTVWLLRSELGAVWRWLLPTCFAGVLAVLGARAKQSGDTAVSATFLAGATLAAAPCLLSWLGAVGWLSGAPEHVRQLFPGDFSNLQVWVASTGAFVASAICLARFRMTGFAWTTAVLGVASYLGLLLVFNWLDQRLEIQALWCLPLALAEPFALWLERRGWVRWTLPFHLIALTALVGALDVMALQGPTLEMMGLRPGLWSYFDHDRLVAFSLVLNGACFLGLMLLAERSSSLDLRRASKLLEVLALVHMLSALYLNALGHRDQPFVRADVWLYLVFALAFTVLAPLRSRWRLLVGGLVGLGLGSYLLVDLQLVARKPFILSLGSVGVLVALAAFFYVRRRSRSPRSLKALRPPG